MEEIKGDLSCVQIGKIEPYQFAIPAIRIVDTLGDSEHVMEFATAEDYKIWKELEDKKTES